MRTLVIGGGIAGTATALGLHRAGLDVEVYEAHPDSAEDIGAFLTLASNGMRALAQLDAAAAVGRAGFPLTSMRVLAGTGVEVARVPLGEADDPVLRFRCLRRGELSGALQAEAGRRGVRIRHGARLESVEQGPDGVTARFRDGSTATGDLLVAADGLNSTVRGALAPGVRPVHAGQRVFYGYTDTAPDGPGDGLITMVRGSGAAFGYAVSPGGETYWFARVAGEPLTGEEIARGTAAHWRELLLPALRGDATPAAGLVEATDDDLMATNATEIPTGTRWRHGRVLLLGDAAHAASPATGQGASMALEDAVVLAKCLRDAPDIDSASALYEALRRPRVEHNVTVSGGISRGATSGPGDPGRAGGPGGPAGGARGPASDAGDSASRPGGPAGGAGGPAGRPGGPAGGAGGPAGSPGDPAAGARGSAHGPSGPAGGPSGPANGAGDSAGSPGDPAGRPGSPAGGPGRGGPPDGRPGEEDLVRHLDWTSDIWETDGRPV